MASEFSLQRFLLFLTVLRPAVSECLGGSVYNAAKNRCYNLVDIKQSFLDAEKSCTALGGHLASIQNGFDNSIVNQASATFTTDIDFWIGGSDLNSPGNWTWTRGGVLNYTSWDSGFPNNIQDADCTAFRKNAKWRNEDCAAAKAFACEIAPVGSCSGCPSDWTYNLETDSCYKSVFYLNWTDANSACVSLGANLVSLHSDSETQILSAIAKTGYPIGTSQTTWIGLVYTNTTGNWTWAWTDGSAVDYLNWEDGYPYVTEYNKCASIYLDPYSLGETVRFLHWENIDCDSIKRNAVCKMPAAH